MSHGVPSPLASHWSLDPALIFLNHGAFGAATRAVQAEQSAIRARMERDPIRFLYLDFEGLLDEARRAVAAFVGARAEDLVFLPNATSGVNHVLSSFDFAPGDELLLSDHVYPACRNAAAYWTARAGARVVELELPLPLDPDTLVAAILAKLSPRTRLALIDHVTSPSALVLPIARIVQELRARGVPTLVDGAHAPGMLPLALSELDADYYTGNFHKWCCAPKGAAFLCVRAERRAGLRPALQSHGAAIQRDDRSRFWLEFDWTGTFDPSALLAVPRVLRELGSYVEGGWPSVYARNHALALEARALLADALGGELICTNDGIGSMAALALPHVDSPAAAESLYRALLDRHAIQVPITRLPQRRGSFVRVSAHLYNALEDYARLATALTRELRL